MATLSETVPGGGGKVLSLGIVELCDLEQNQGVGFVGQVAPANRHSGGKQQYSAVLC